jgi:hypothetical protein
VSLLQGGCTQDGVAAGGHHGVFGHLLEQGHRLICTDPPFMQHEVVKFLHHLGADHETVGLHGGFDCSQGAHSPVAVHRVLGGDQDVGVEETPAWQRGFGRGAHRLAPRDIEAADFSFGSVG